MITFKTTLKCLIVLTAILGFAIGCGVSAENQAMLDFLTTYENAVNEFSAADESKRVELKEKLDSFKSKWAKMKMEMGSEVTPQTIDKLDNKYKEITEKYTLLANKS